MHVAALVILISQLWPVALTDSVLVWWQTVQVYCCSPAVRQVGALVISPGCHLWPPRDGLVCTSLASLQRVQRYVVISGWVQSCFWVTVPLE